MGAYGIDRSLWLDEAWVANSIREPTLARMFHYPDWLQTSPPAFLLLARGVVAAFGLSNLTLRMIPLAMGAIAVGLLAATVTRLSTPALGLLAGTWLAIHPVAVEYSRSFKQYSG